MEIEFEQLAAHCRDGELSGVCSIMQEAEAVCQLDDPGFKQDCDCCEEHCPIKTSQHAIPRNVTAEPLCPQCGCNKVILSAYDKKACLCSYCYHQWTK